MPVLDFKGKTVIYSHHLRVPFRSLKVDEKKSLFNKSKSGKANLDDNLIIQGDNLHALKALLPRYAGKVKCIYIDPPYNTGNEGWKYNDKVNSPVIKEWLKQNGIGTDDLERHDKWLCMMWPRLQLLKELLADDGVIFVSIDDNEQHHLRMIMNEIFGEDNFIASIARITKLGGNKGDLYKPKKDCILFYAKDVNGINKETYGKLVNSFNYKWKTEIFNGKERKFCKGDIPYRDKLDVRPNQRYYIQAPDGSLIIPKGNVFPDKKTDAEKAEPKSKEDKCWTWSRSTYLSEKKKGRFLFVRSTRSPFLNENKQQSKWTVYKKIFEEDLKNKRQILSDVILNCENSLGTAELQDIEIQFAYSKPSKLITDLIEKTCSNKDSIILDSFAGSGTTAQAVLDLNKEDGGNRKFILVECEDYADKITAERVRRVIKGIPKAKDEKLKKGLGGSFTYCNLGEEININNMLKGKLPDYKQLAEYIFYTATGKNLDKIAKTNPAWFIGETGTYRFHLVYKPDLDFLKSKKSALHLDLAEAIQKFNKGFKKISLVYAPASYITQKNLNNKYSIQFCQLPTAIHKIIGI